VPANRTPAYSEHSETTPYSRTVSILPSKFRHSAIPLYSQTLPVRAIKWIRWSKPRRKWTVHLFGIWSMTS